MDFELTMRLFLGEKAYHIAGQESQDKSRREWFLKAAKKILKRIDDLESTNRHEQMLMSEAEQLIESLKGKIHNPWFIVYRLFRLCGRLLGFDFVKGAIVHTPIYHQTENQYYTSEILTGGDVMQDYYDKKDTVSTRKRIADQLKKEGMTDFKIALVMNTTEYQIKKLRKGL